LHSSSGHPFDFSNYFAVHFIDLFSDQPQNPPALPAQEVVLARSRARVLVTLASEPTVPFHPMQERVESPRADLVAMTTQFAHHPLPVDWALGCMVENMNLPKAKKDLPSYSI
jgi:hypothetical protein